MENSYSRQLSRKVKIASVSPNTNINSYKYARVRLPLISKNNLKNHKSASDYSTAPSKRVKQGYYEKSFLKPVSSKKQKSISRNLVTDRERSKSKNERLKQQQLLSSNNSNILKQSLRNKQQSLQRSTSNEDHSLLILECSINTLDTEPILTKRKRIFQFDTVGPDWKKGTIDLGQNYSMKTTDILDNYQNHCRKYQTEHTKIIRPDKIKPKQFQVSKELQKVQDLNRKTEKSIQKYIEYKKIRIQQIMNQKLVSRILDNSYKTKRKLT